MKKIYNSLNFKIFSIFIIVIIPLIVFVFYANLYSMSVVRNQVSKSYSDLLTSHVTQIEKNMSVVETHLMSILETNDNIKGLSVYSNGSLSNMLAKLNTMNRLKDELSYYPYAEAFFIYYEKNDDIILSVNKQKNYDDTLMFLKQNLKDLLSARESSWMLVRSGNHYLLLKLFNSLTGIHIGALVSIQDLMAALSSVNLGEGGSITAVSEKGDYVSNTADRLSPDEIKKVITGSDAAYHIIKADSDNISYLVVAKKLAIAPMRFVAIMPERNLLMDLPFFQIAIFIIPASVLLLLLFYLYSMRSFLFKPMNDIIKGLKAVSEGNLDIKLAEKGVNEFEFVIRVFNQMVQNIKALKINVYEEKIKVQKAELKHLQVQIHPHFYSNSLNTIYNLAFLKDFRSVQAMASYLAKYFRFVIRTDKESIRIKEELEHIVNYLEIQKFRFPDNLSYDIEVPEAYNNYMLPPLTIQTFVENSIVHGFNEKNEMLKIHIKIRQDPNEPDSFYLISVSDNGNGFPPDILSRLNSEEYILSGGEEHIGIWNVCRRLQMFFSAASVSLEFGNNLPGGAIVNIRLPLNSQIREV